MRIFTAMMWAMLMHSPFTPECFLIPTANRKITTNIVEIQQEKQAAFALNVEKMWSALFLNCKVDAGNFEGFRLL